MEHTQKQQMDLLKNSVAMTVTLISFGMLFATLFLGYFLVRSNAPVWPPVEIEGMPKLLPFASTLVMLMSSLTYYWFEKQTATRKLALGMTFLLGLAFLALQWALWGTLKDSGILTSHGMVPSMVYAFTWLHAGHIVLALLVLGWLGTLLVMKPEVVTPIKIINVGKFWHFLGVVWILMYLMLFVL